MRMTISAVRTSRIFKEMLREREERARAKVPSVDYSAFRALSSKIVLEFQNGAERQNSAAST